MIKNVSTKKAPGAIGPYSQAIIAGPFIYVSGQIPMDPATSTIVEADIAIQTKQSLDNLKAILDEAGYTMSDVVKTSVFLSDMNNFADMNAVYATFFKEPYPARAAVEVARLPKDVMVEIEAIAFKQFS